MIGLLEGNGIGVNPIFRKVNVKIIIIIKIACSAHAVI